MKSTYFERPRGRFLWLGMVIPLSLLFGFLAYPYLSSRILWPSVTVLPDPTPHPFKHDYHFTSDWLSGQIPVWSSVLKAYQAKPNVQYLEVGIYEGRSMLWMLDNILTDPTSHATGIDSYGLLGIDPFVGDLDVVKERFLLNLKLSGQAERVTVIQGFSQIELRKLPLESYDIVYIDGSHRSDDTLEDIVLSSRLLKPGGLLIMDDYGKAWFYEGYRQPFDKPQFAMDSFYAAFRSKFDVVHRAYQVILRKKPSA